MSESLHPAATAPDAAPAHTPEAVLFEAMAAALVRSLGGKKGHAFLRAMTSELAMRVNVAEAIPLRCRARDEHGAKLEATRQAVTVYRCALPALVSACWPRDR